MPVILQLVEPSKRAYPHVEGIADWRAQQSIRLLWDRAAALDARLHAVEATVGDLVTALNRLETQLTRVDRKADEALAKAQGASGILGGGDGTGGGEPTIPDYSAVVATVIARYDPVIAAADEDEGKAQLTRAVAWEIYQTNPAIGLIEKLTGHQVAGFSTDKLVQQSNGDFADVATSNTSGLPAGMIRIVGTWSPGAGDGSLISQWTEPTAALAAMAGPMTIL